MVSTYLQEANDIFKIVTQMLKEEMPVTLRLIGPSPPFTLPSQLCSSPDLLCSLTMVAMLHVLPADSWFRY